MGCYSSPLDLINKPISITVNTIHILPVIKNFAVFQSYCMLVFVAHIVSEWRKYVNCP